MPSLDSVTLDATGFTPEGDRNGVRVWRTALGDGLGLYYFAKPPNINAELADMDGLRAFYRRLLIRAGHGLIELEPMDVEGCKAFYTIIKVPQTPTGMTYLGAITVPFRDFSYVLKVQCEEHGTTGIRETMVMDMLLGEGKIKLHGIDGRGRVPGWMRDPYDPTVDMPVMRNLAEDEPYDARFPTHPLSRARAVLRQIRPSLRVDAELRSAPGFVFDRTMVEQVVHPVRRPWWKIR